MSFRIEEKLYIRYENLLDFKNFLYKNSAKNLYEPRKIKSLYYDNLNLEMYTDSIEGNVPRKKIRIRNYPDNDDEKYYLEIKNSSVEGRYKTRKIINKKEVSNLKKNGIFDNQYGSCFPTFIVSYNREYISYKGVRLSIDQNIKYESFKNNSYIKDNKIIVEVKTSIEQDMDFLVKTFPFQRIRFSKYCYAVETLKY
tara:strand:- start:1175 stop:1765 length:591 start_codon:yes stop_codon:yes gene_type:complete